MSLPMLLSPSLLAAPVTAPWHIVGLVMAILITLVPLIGVLTIYFKLAKRPPHKPVGELPLAGALPSQKKLSATTRALIEERVDEESR